MRPIGGICEVGVLSGQPVGWAGTGPNIDGKEDKLEQA